MTTTTTTMTTKASKKNFSFIVTNNHAETGLDIEVFGLNVILQYVKAISYLGLVIGTPVSRTSVFIYKLPKDVPMRDKFKTQDEAKTTVGSTTVREVSWQYGRRLLLGIERIITTTTLVVPLEVKQNN